MPFLRNEADYTNTTDEYLPIACTQLTLLPPTNRHARQLRKLFISKPDNYITI